jgi:hypothetical protein
VRLIQAQHPDIDFDWPQLLKGRQEPALPERARPDASQRDRAPRPADRNDRADRRGRAEAGRRSERRPAAPEAPDPRPVRAAVPAAPPPALEVPDTPADPGPAGARLGAAGLDRLRARYREVLTRIAQRVEDDARRGELNTLAERLNPDSWTSDEAVSAGLEAYEETFDAVKSGVGGRRKPASSPDAATSTDPEPR